MQPQQSQIVRQLRLQSQPPINGQQRQVSPYVSMNNLGNTNNQTRRDIPTINIIRSEMPSQQTFPQSQIKSQPIQQLQYSQQPPPTQYNGVSQQELTKYLEDLQRRYDILAQEIQRNSQKDIANGNDMTNATTTMNQRVIQFQIERDALSQAAQAKDDEIKYLQQQIQTNREQYNQELNRISLDHDQIVSALTEKLDQMNTLVKNKVYDLEQTKSVLYLREQEVNEWRNRKPNDVNSIDNSQLQQKIRQLQNENQQLQQLRQGRSASQSSQFNLQSQFNVGQSDQEQLLYCANPPSDDQEVEMLKAQLEEKDQELKTLRIKYEYKQRTQQSNDQEYNMNMRFVDDEAQEKIEILQNEVKRLNQTITQLRQQLDAAQENASDARWAQNKLKEQQVEITQLRSSQNVYTTQQKAQVNSEQKYITSYSGYSQHPSVASKEFKYISQY